MAKRDGSTYQVDFSAHAVYATAHDYLVVATSTKPGRPVILVGPHSALKRALRSSTRPSPPPANDPRLVKLGFAPVCIRQVRN